MMQEQNYIDDRYLDEVDEELSEQFTFDGFQVVRGEFFSHLREPSISLADCKIYANSASVNKLPNSDYVQVLVNSNEKKLVIKPVDEDAKDAFLWRRFNENKGRFVPKHITCRVFFAKIMELMNWNPNDRYKLLGKLIRSGDDFLFVFDLNAAERYERLQKTDGSTKRSRIPIFPAEWKNQFGLSVEEHSKQLQVNIFEGYAVFDISKKNEEGETEWQNQTTADQPSHSTL